MAFWSIWLEKTFRVFWCSNRLRHINLDVSVAVWKKDNIFGNFVVRHANQGWIKYNVCRQPKITWYEVSPSITCMRVCALIGSTLKSKDTCPRVHCCNDLIPTTWSGSRMILSHRMPKASNVEKGKILVEVLVSTEALIIWEAPKRVVTYKGLSPSTTQLDKSMADKVTDSLVSWNTTCNKFPSKAAVP